MDIQIPNLNQLLDTIDPNKTIDRKQAVTDITSVVILKSLGEFRNSSTPEIQAKLDVLMGDSQNLNLEDIYELISEVNKLEDYLQIVNKNIEFVRTDYIKTHLAALSVEKREQLFSQYPSLKQI